jgi:hypothetical protein|tara:strand:+ start:2376 stop:2666 length:291 start_codon:yes stop_codon:yes gene_type:complete
MSELSKKEVVKLIGKKTVLKFQCCHDNIFIYETLVPIFEKDFFSDGVLYNISIHNDNGGVFNSFDQLKNLIECGDFIDAEENTLSGKTKTIFTDYK